MDYRHRHCLRDRRPDRYSPDRPLSGLEFRRSLCPCHSDDRHPSSAHYRIWGGYRSQVFFFHQSTAYEQCYGHIGLIADYPCCLVGTAVCRKDLQRCLDTVFDPVGWSGIVFRPLSLKGLHPVFFRQTSIFLLAGCRSNYIDGYIEFDVDTAVGYHRLGSGRTFCSHCHGHSQHQLLFVSLLPSPIR